MIVRLFILYATIAEEVWYFMLLSPVCFCTKLPWDGMHFLAVCTQELPGSKEESCKGLFLQMYFQNSPPTIPRRKYISFTRIFMWQLMEAPSAYFANSAKPSMFACEKDSHAASVAW